MNSLLLQRFIDLIAAQTGLHIRAQDRESVCKKLLARITTLKVFTPEEYYRLLELNTSRSSEQEWQELIPSLTTGESYFFRDRGQFNLLRQRILPEIIAAKQSELSVRNYLEKPTLRIWSAGCSTGEEPYSLAILVSELIPNLEAWNLLILGTDINNEAIAKARKGVYSQWSFRMMPTELRLRYFQPTGKGWQIDQQIRQMVTFNQGNLLKDFFPSYGSNMNSMDIILCRNVFIYFSATAIATVVEKFIKTLNLRGYLINGHAELHGQQFNRLESRMFAESVVYQRCSTQLDKTALNSSLNSPQEALTNLISNLSSISAANTGESLSPFSNFLNREQPSVPTNQLLPNPSTPVNLQSSEISSLFTNNSNTEISNLNFATSKNEQNSAAPSITNYSQNSPQTAEQIKQLFDQEDYQGVIIAAEKFLQTFSEQVDVCGWLANAYANLGKYDAATKYCQKIISINTFAIEPYYLLAQMAEEQGNTETAKEFLKKVIYLQPKAIAAYLSLGSIYEHENDLMRAQKMRTTALRLLESMPANAQVERHPDFTAGELSAQVRQMLP